MGDLLHHLPTAWADALPPTRSAALTRIERVRPAAYARTRNQLDGAVTGLSPYLTHGLVTLPEVLAGVLQQGCLLYTSPSPRDRTRSRMPSSA